MLILHAILAVAPFTPSNTDRGVFTIGMHSKCIVAIQVVSHARSVLDGVRECAPCHLLPLSACIGCDLSARHARPRGPPPRAPTVADDELVRETPRCFSLLNSSPTRRSAAVLRVSQGQRRGGDAPARLCRRRGGRLPRPRARPPSSLCSPPLFPP